MTEAEVQKGVVAGVSLALTRAKTWSYGRTWPGDTGAENLLQVSIAQKVFGAATTIPPVIELEATLSRLGVEDDRRRVDIALMRHAHRSDRPHPFCVIEVKKAPAPFLEDLAKIECLINQAPTIKYAFLATYFQHRLSVSGRSRRKERVIDDLDDVVRAAATDRDLTCRRVAARFIGRQVEDEEGHAHCAGAVIHRFSRT